MYTGNWRRLSQRRGHLEAAGGLAAPLPWPRRQAGPALASVLPGPHEGHQPGPRATPSYRVTLTEYFSLESPPSGVGFHIFIVKLSFVDTGGSL